MSNPRILKMIASWHSNILLFKRQVTLGVLSMLGSNTVGVAQECLWQVSWLFLPEWLVFLSYMRSKVTTCCVCNDADVNISVFILFLYFYYFFKSRCADVSTFLSKISYLLKTSFTLATLRRICINGGNLDMVRLLMHGLSTRDKM